MVCNFYNDLPCLFT